MDWRFDFTAIDDGDGKPRIGLRVDAVMARTDPEDRQRNPAAGSVPASGADALVIGRAGRRRTR